MVEFWIGIGAVTSLAGGRVGVLPLFGDGRKEVVVPGDKYDLGGPYVGKLVGFYLRKPREIREDADLEDLNMKKLMWTTKTEIIRASIVDVRVGEGEISVVTEDDEIRVSFAEKVIIQFNWY